MLKIKVTSGNVSVEIEMPITERSGLGIKEDGTGYAIVHVTKHLFEQIKEHKKI